MLVYETAGRFFVHHPVLSLTIKEYARAVLECIQLVPNRARINGEESCGSITLRNR
jgi:hypothetical protein